MSENEPRGTAADVELRKAIDRWREEALIAEEQGAEYYAEECLRRAEALERRLSKNAATSPLRRPR